MQVRLYFSLEDLIAFHNQAMRLKKTPPTSSRNNICIRPLFVPLALPDVNERKLKWTIYQVNYRFGEAVLFALMANHIGEAIEAIREMFFFLGGGRDLGGVNYKDLLKYYNFNCSRFLDTGKQEIKRYGQNCFCAKANCD